MYYLVKTVLKALVELFYDHFLFVYAFVLILIGIYTKAEDNLVIANLLFLLLVQYAGIEGIYAVMTDYRYSKINCRRIVWKEKVTVRAKHCRFLIRTAHFDPDCVHVALASYIRRYMLITSIGIAIWFLITLLIKDKELVAIMMMFELFPWLAILVNGRTYIEEKIDIDRIY